MASDIEIYEWKRRNWGLISKIAQECRVHRSFVSLIIHGKRSSSMGYVEKALQEAGCPIQIKGESK